MEGFRHSRVAGLERVGRVGEASVGLAGATGGDVKPASPPPVPHWGRNRRDSKGCNEKPAISGSSGLPPDHGPQKVKVKNDCFWFTHFGGVGEWSTRTVYIGW